MMTIPFKNMKIKLNVLYKLIGQYKLILSQKNSTDSWSSFSLESHSVVIKDLIDLHRYSN